MARAQTVGLNVGPDAREAVRSLRNRLTGETNRVVTLTEAIVAACSVAGNHLDELRSALTDPDTKP